MTKTQNLKVRTTLYIDSEIVEHAKSNPQIKSLSDWITNVYSENFLEINNIEKKLCITMHNVDILKSTLDKLRSEKDTLPISNEGMSWTRNEGMKRLRKGFQVDSVLKFFNNKFGVSLSLRQFKLLIKKIEVEKDE